MDIKFKDVLELFEFVSFGDMYEHEGYICKETGKTYFHAEFDDLGEELPDDIDSEKYLAIPHKNELNVGRNLAFEFTLHYLPSEYEQVCSFFRHEGAYARFKSLLASLDKIDEWYKFESERKEQALREWCSLYGINVSD